LRNMVLFVLFLINVTLKGLTRNRLVLPVQLLSSRVFELVVSVLSRMRT
jgi:hypothetical protein